MGRRWVKDVEGRGEEEGERCGGEGRRMGRGGEKDVEGRGGGEGGRMWRGGVNDEDGST